MGERNIDSLTNKRANFPDYKSTSVERPRVGSSCN